MKVETEINETEVHFKDQWEAMVWMKTELRKRGLDINPMAKDFNDKVWFRYSLMPKPNE